MLHQGKTLLLREEAYPDTYRTAIHVLTIEKKFLCELTINLPDEVLKPGELCIPLAQALDGLVHSARESGLFVDTGRRIERDGVVVEVWAWDTTPHD
jgi:hypothetical protein